MDGVHVVRIMPESNVFNMCMFITVVTAEYRKEGNRDTPVETAQLIKTCCIQTILGSQSPHMRS